MYAWKIGVLRTYERGLSVMRADILSGTPGKLVIKHKVTEEVDYEEGVSPWQLSEKDAWRVFLKTKKERYKVLHDKLVRNLEHQVQALYALREGGRGPGRFRYIDMEAEQYQEETPESY